MTEAAGSGKNNDVRLFLGAVLAFACVFGIGGWFLFTALNRPAETAGHVPDHPRHLINFTLTDRTGRTVTQAEMTGKFLVVNFLFTSCSLTCPVVNRCMAQIQQLTTNQPDVKLVSLTVDPRDDTPEVLAKYGERFGADTNRWLLLTGEKTELYNLIGTSFLAQAPEDPFNYMPGNFADTDHIALVNPHGQVLALFDGLRPDVAKAIVTEITRQRE